MRRVGVSSVAAVLLLATALVWALSLGEEPGAGATAPPAPAVAAYAEETRSGLAAEEALLTPAAAAGAGAQAVRTAVAVEPLERAFVDADGAPAPGLIKARVVRAGGEPLSSATVQLFVPSLQDNGSEYQPCAQDGTYRRRVQLPFPDEIVLCIATPHRDLYQVRFRSPGGVGALWDLGDVVVPPEPQLRVEVRDELGAPVAKAQVTSSPQRSSEGVVSGLRSVFTDGAGAAVLEVREGVEDGGACHPEYVGVYHPDHAPIVKPAPLDLGTPLLFTLRRPATLLVDFEVLTGGDALAGEDWNGTPNAHYFLLFTWEEAQAGAGRAAVRPRPAERVPVEGTAFPLANAEPFKPVSGIAPAGVPLRLLVTDRLGRTVHEETLTPLAAGEVKKHHVRVEWQPTTLCLRVLDPAGQPIANAGVMLDGVYRCWTGPAGEVRSTGLAPGPLDLTLTHRLYADLHLSSFEPGAGEETFEVRLVPC
jgi:hypothetical protein